jgi:hypothetical protein
VSVWLLLVHVADSEGSSEPEDAWLQQQQQGGGGSESPGSPGGAQPSQPAVQREDWMTVPMARPFAGQPDNKQREKQQQEKEVRIHAVSSRAVALRVLQVLLSC